MRVIETITAAVVAASAWAGGAVAQDFRFLGAWEPSQERGLAYLHENFVPRLGEAIPGATVSTFGPETVPTFEQLEPLQQGVFQFLYTNMANHFGETRGAFAAVAINADAAQQREAGIWQVIDEHYQTLGAKLIAMITTRDGYQFVLREPPVDGSLEGFSIRGTQLYGGVAEHLGAALVVIPFGETYTALERGVVDGAGLPFLSTTGSAWNEVAPYNMTPRFGTVISLLLMNLDAFNALNPEEQEALLELGREMEVGAAEEMQAAFAVEAEALQAAGSQDAPISPDLAEGLQRAFADDLFELSAETDPEPTARLRELAQAAGYVE